tara:strand:- start:799 stop:1149 length:351 start_codon:yes stop_codon:yes gene_type:complete
MEVVGGNACTTSDGNGTLLRAMIPVGETATGEVHYKAQVSTLGGADFYYPADGEYYILAVSYRASYGSTFGAIAMFLLVAGTVWGGLGAALRTMFAGDDDEKVLLADALLEEAVDA